MNTAFKELLTIIWTQAVQVIDPGHIHIGEPALPPPISPARSPPEEQSFDWDQTASEAAGQGELLFEPPPECEFDQTVRG